MSLFLTRVSDLDTTRVLSFLSFSQNHVRLPDDPDTSFHSLISSYSIRSIHLGQFSSYLEVATERESLRMHPVVV